MVQRELYNVRGLPKKGEIEKGEQKAHILLRALFNQTRWEFISSDGEFVSSNHESIQFCVLSSYSIITNIHINRCQNHQSLALRPILYKFIVMSPLGLDPIHLWAQFENRNPTLI